ncbi:MAG: hypothetical protein AAFY91_06670 [Bacteroidota bacterium]
MISLIDVMTYIGVAVAFSATVTFIFASLAFWVNYCIRRYRHTVAYVQFLQDKEMFKKKKQLLNKIERELREKYHELEQLSNQKTIQ